MKINTFLLFFLFLITNSYSQDYASMFSVKIKNKGVVVFQAVNKKSNETTMFLADNKKINAILLNDSVSYKDSMSSNMPTEIYKNIVGYTIADKKTTLFWAKEDFSSIFLQSFNFNSRTVGSKFSFFNINEQKIIQVFSENGNFYILTYSQSEQQFKLIVFDENNESKEMILDSKLLNSNTLNLLLSSNLSNNKGGLTIEKIATEIPVFFTESLNKNKCYSNENNIVITFDNDLSVTSMIIIDLKTFSIEEKLVPKFNTIDGVPTTYSNSFVLDDKLIQVEGTNENISISIKDFNNNIIKEFNSKKDSQIFDAITYYKESIIGSPTILTNKESFLNQMEESKFGFSCYKTRENIVISIGKPIRLVKTKATDDEVSDNYYSLAGGMIGGAIGSLTGTLIGLSFSNPSSYSFFNSMNKGRTYFNFWMDLNYNEVPMKNRDLAFEKMRKFLKTQNSEPGQTIFKVNNKSYFGFYNFKEERYFIRKFID